MRYQFHNGESDQFLASFSVGVKWTSSFSNRNSDIQYVFPKKLVYPLKIFDGMYVWILSFSVEEDFTTNVSNKIQHVSQYKLSKFKQNNLVYMLLFNNSNLLWIHWQVGFERNIGKNIKNVVFKM